MKDEKMRMRLITILTGIFLIAGCDRPPATRVSSSVLKLRSQSEGVVTFDAQIRKGDSLCWQHGDDGSVVSSTWPEDRVTVLTISTESGRVQSIPIERATLLAPPRMEKGRHRVGEYVEKRGFVVETPETPLSVYVKEGS